MDGQSQTDSSCYSNGIKRQSIVTSDKPSSVTEIAKNGSTICYSADMVYDSKMGTASFVIRDGSGDQVATADRSPDMSVTMTRTGGQPTVLSDSCLNKGDYTFVCTPGICVF